MTGNRALQAGVNGITTTTGSITLGYLPGQVQVPDVLVLSAASAVTVTLPPIVPSNTALGIGTAQNLRILNLAAQSVAIVAAGSDTLYGSSATIAQNASAHLITDSKLANWYRQG